MIIRFEHDGTRFEITTEHPAASYGRPVVLVDGTLTDGAPHYEQDAVEQPHPLDVLASAANVHDGPVTRGRLHGLAAAMLAGVERPTGADYDRVISEFTRRGRELAAAE